MKEYTEVFNLRGNSYDTAMSLFPKARDNEFINLFNSTSLENIKNLLDIPAGGGYLSRILPKHINLIELDPSKNFFLKNAHVNSFDETIPYKNNTFNCVVCLAALHHIEPKKNFLQECLRVLCTNSFFCVADVMKNSPEALFLDSIVDKYTPLGHKGNYIENNKAKLQQLFDPAIIINSEYRSCAWQFNSRQDLGLFCSLLFGLEGISIDNLLSELDSRIGIFEKAETVYLNWNLLYISCLKKW